MTSHYEKIPTENSKFEPNIFSRLLFCWLNGLLLQGYRRPLKSEDLLPLFDEDKAQGLVKKLDELWKKEVMNAQKRGTNPRLWKAIWKLFPMYLYLLSLILMLAHDLMEFALTFLIWCYLKLLKGNVMSSTHSWLVVTSMAVIGVFKVIVYHHYPNLVRLTAILSALTGMLLSFAMALLADTQYGLRMACEVESQMTSVERVMTYSKLPSEPGYSRQKKPPEDWPNQGSLSLRDVSIVYLDGGPCALKRINIDVLPKEKIGIAGRTGAGKSSLVAALFRMPDPQGQVLIDGIDLGTIDIQAARRSMAVITQDPVLFAGSIKKNLDPFNHFTEQEIWTALEAVQLKHKISSLVGKLGFCVGEGGSGFSVGERQLLCLARALLQKSKILVLDEATANVDYKTDQLIQQVIRQKFTNCTVLTIAHRVNTIMDYDKVVVLDQGQVVEYDNPTILALFVFS